MAISDRRADDFEECSEINLTPFIDVILVLLIITMIAAQASSVAQPVDLPRSGAKPVAADARPVVVTVRADRTLVVNDRPVSRPGLRRALITAGLRRDDRVLLAADRSLSYAMVMDALDALRDAGYTRVALVGRERER
ncbi:TonB system transport protein ExbD [Sphingomonas endophytica]|uniref:Biopolymer transport protein ExbD n=1 Tax=Sphingomonas endophytica TaxID=869719 RepID=A0ABR6N6Y3_9SPHN|nr:biopolymer transporter ExbD [Sphingomonas endophytica]MBB5725801.1 biopolymer transport protein ExbD [Sphingomonas endophytica]